MIIAVDIGNTHIVIGAIGENHQVEHTVRMETNTGKTEYEYAADMKLILQFGGIDVERAEGVIISSVVPPVTVTMRRAMKILTGRNALVVGAGVKTGIDIAIDDPGTIAADLVATAVAAKNFYPLPCCIIDMGTATTVTVVDERGRYLGGAIQPGIALSLRALTSGTSLLPNIEIVPPQKVIASNTVDSMKAGVVFGNAGAIDGILDRFIQELGPGTSVVATGGLARTICPYCRHEIIIDDELLLRGLSVIWEKNRGHRRKDREQKG